MKKISMLVALYFFCCPVIFNGAANAGTADLTVFAAASTTNALSEIAAEYDKTGKGKITLSFGSSSTLAKQIENGAAADIFLSANPDWMNYLEEKKILRPDSRKTLLGNTIVLIVPAASQVQDVKIDSSLDLAAILGKDGRLAVGDPAHVPVGTYGKAALEKLGLWGQVEKRLAPAKDVRAGMLLVEQDESPLGLVYGSDAAISDKVRVIGVFPADSHPEISYPIALTADAKNAAVDFILFLSTPESQKIWKKYGFELR